MNRDVVLDQALALGDDRTGLEGLRTQLDDSAPAVIDGTGPLPARVAAARAEMHATMRRDAEAVGYRLRLELAVITVVAAVFGAILLGAAAKQGGALRERHEG